MISDELESYWRDRDTLAEFHTSFTDATVRLGDAFISELNNRMWFNDAATRAANILIFDTAYEQLITLLPYEDYDEDVKAIILHKLIQVKKMRDRW